jgi:3'-phosphoadenosine 5'-phosphosulfate sulfotransferase (PAPS reductase)/FAD synthetase
MCHSLDEVKRFVARFDSSVAFVINHSGGKDSTRMLGFVRESFPNPNIVTLAVMADTGFEHQHPVSAADFAQSRCAEFDVPFIVVRNPRRTYLEMVEQRDGMFPSAQYRQCTSDLKRGPIEKYIRTLLLRLIFNCMGIRAEESPQRSKLKPLSLNTSLTTRTRTVYNWFPIFEQTLFDVLAWHRENTIPLHPVYVACLP